MLALYSKNEVDWKKNVHKVLVALVNKNGAWAGSVLEQVKKNGVHVRRIRHVIKNVFIRDIAVKYLKNIV